MNYEYPIRLRVASVALALMLMLVLVAITIPSAQAQTFTVLYKTRRIALRTTTVSGCYQVRWADSRNCSRASNELSHPSRAAPESFSTYKKRNPIPNESLQTTSALA
jgi:hypothetical protein